MGVACVSSQERETASWTACVAHVAVAPSGEVKVKKLTVATDVGTQVHPDNIRAQVEGAALWGLSLAMYEKATLKDGGIEQTNFDTYTPLRMSQMPEVAISVIANGEQATGVGEPAVTVIAPGAGECDLQRLRRSRPLAADHGRGREGRHVRRNDPKGRATNQSAGGQPPADFWRYPAGGCVRIPAKFYRPQYELHSSYPLSLRETRSRLGCAAGLPPAKRIHDTSRQPAFVPPPAAAGVGSQRSKHSNSRAFCNP